jgi:cobalt-zinc-cadmium efflux system membrane fusion protein
MERADKLFAEQIIPQKDHLRARSDLEKARAVLRSASGRLGAYGVRPQPVSDTSGSAIYAITAPFAGTVIGKKAVQGELAQPDTPLFEVADLSTVWIDTHLYEKDLARVRTGSSAEVSVAAYPNERFKGTVAYIASVMDSETRTVPARVTLANPDGRLKLGMFATTSISTAAAGKSLVVPVEAVVLISGQPTVFVREGGGFEARAVQLGDKRGANVLLASGVAPGTEVVTRGAYALKAKMLKSQISAEE